MQKGRKVKTPQNFGRKIGTPQKRFGKKLCLMPKMNAKQAKKFEKY